MKFFKKIKFTIFILLTFGLVGLGFSQAIPKPEEILGFKVGADYHLATYDQTLAYFKISKF